MKKYRKPLCINPLDYYMSRSTRSNMRRRNNRETSDSSDNESDKSASTNRSHSTNSSRKRSRTNSSGSIPLYSDHEHEHDNHSQYIESEEEEQFYSVNDDLNLIRLEEEHQREMVKVYKRFGQFIKPIARGCFPYIKQAFAVSAIYIFWITLHFTTAHFYVQFCAYPSLYGFLLSPFLISSPHCAAMRWIFTKGGTLIDGMWIILGTWLCSKVLYRDV